jgi:polyhydroxyalkanoate synthesis repressor PhaR
MNQKIRLFKKHANRRLYDTKLKKYVSLDHILALINSGTDVKIEDAKTGEDISRPILLQIMADCEQRGQPMLSPAMLMTLIRHYGHPMQGFVGPFLEKSLGFYMRQEAALRRRMSDLVEEGTSGKITKASRESFAAMRDNLMQILKSAKRD